jgi:O-antigen/teichoic acid export membrane protein
MLASIAATWATAVIQIFLIDRRIEPVVRAAVAAYSLKTWLAAALPIVMINGVFYLFSYIDILLLQEFRPPEDVAIYFAATKLVAIITMVYFSVTAAAARKFAEYGASGDREELAAFFAASARWMFWPSLLASAGVLVAGFPLLWLYGPEFVAGYPLLFIMVIGVLARASIGPVESLLVMLGRQGACVAVYAAALALNFTLCFLLIPRFGPAAAAASTALSILVESALLFLVTKKLVGISPFVALRTKKPAFAAQP